MEFARTGLTCASLGGEGSAVDRPPDLRYSSIWLELSRSSKPR
jgi:hypothetical protein